MLPPKPTAQTLLASTPHRPKRSLVVLLVLAVHAVPFHLRVLLQRRHAYESRRPLGDLLQRHDNGSQFRQRVHGSGPNLIPGVPPVWAMHDT